MDGLWKKPVRPSRTARFASGAAPRACSLWLLSLARARESNSAARKADETHTDVSRLSRSAKSKIKVKMDTGFRRNDGKSWIRAFAGMTSWGGFRGNDS